MLVWSLGCSHASLVSFWCLKVVDEETLRTSIN